MYLTTLSFLALSTSSGDNVLGSQVATGKEWRIVDHRQPTIWTTYTSVSCNLLQGTQSANRFGVETYTRPRTNCSVPRSVYGLPDRPAHNNTKPFYHCGNRDCRACNPTTQYKTACDCPRSPSGRVYHKSNCPEYDPTESS